MKALTDAMKDFQERARLAWLDESSKREPDALDHEWAKIEKATSGGKKRR